MKTQTKLVLVSILPATVIAAIMIVLALEDMKTQREYVADVAVEMMQDEQMLAMQADEIRTLLYQEGSEKGAELARVAIPGILIIMTVLVITALFLVTRITRELNRMMDGVNTMSRPDTPLSFRFSTDKNSEFSQLATDLNEMLQRIDNVIQNIHQMSSSVDLASKSLGDTAELNLNNAQALLINMDSVSTAMTELQHASSEITMNVQEANNEVSDINTEGQRVTTNVKKLNTQLDELRDVTATSSNDVAELSNKVEGIHSILQTIQGIAEQTNLLALNAAIEAARAGDQGRGFAVVADEVRNLASKTQLSTEEISGMINGLREGADRSMKAMEQSSGATNELAEVINSSNEKVLALFQRLTRVNDMNAQIATASEEQSQVISDISQNATEAKTLTENTHSSAQNTGKNAESLSTASRELKAVISQFNFD